MLVVVVKPPARADTNTPYYPQGLSLLIDVAGLKFIGKKSAPALLLSLIHI